MEECGENETMSLVIVIDKEEYAIDCKAARPPRIPLETGHYIKNVLIYRMKS